ncbi:MAG: hypothetical protein R2777_00580 [Chitinophagales bacterium]
MNLTTAVCMAYKRAKGELRSYNDELQPETVSTDFDIADKLYF